MLPRRWRKCPHPVRKHQHEFDPPRRCSPGEQQARQQKGHGCTPLSLDVAAARAAGYSDLVASPTFAVVVQELTLHQLLSEPDAGIDFSRVVHGDQRFTFTRPIVAGDELTATLTVASIRSLGGHSMVTAESSIVGADGGHVVTATSTLVVRGDE